MSLCHVEEQIKGADEDRMMDRRGMLTAAAATAAGLLGAMALPSVAVAAHGDPVLAGIAASVGGSETAISGSNTSLAGGGVGVSAESAAGDAITAISSGAGCCGVDAQGGGSGGLGVFGRGRSAGISGGPWAAVPTADGVWGESISGVGVKAKATTGTALKVDGKAAFTRSGLTSISKKSTSKTIAVPGGVTANSKFLVTLQGSLGAGVNVWCAYAIGSTGFKIKLNKKSTKTGNVAWMVID
ncbi:MAG TPA: hypothetical protein VIK32_16225 [Candidatus Limnocylindrales bacterium]